MIVEEEDEIINTYSETEFGIEVDMSYKVPPDLKLIFTNIRKLT